MAERGAYLICSLPCFLSTEVQSIALKFASKLVNYLLQDHQQVRETELLNSFVIVKVLVVEVTWLLLDRSPSLCFLLCPCTFPGIMSSSLNTLPHSDMKLPSISSQYIPFKVTWR